MSKELKSDDEQLRRVVVELPKGFHRRLKADLTLKGLTFKAWVVRQGKKELGEK